MYTRYRTFRVGNGKRGVITAFIGSTGNVGIGYADPGTAKLAINGNVGIGTTAPSQSLTVVSNGVNNDSRVLLSNNNNSHLQFLSGNGTGTHGGGNAGNTLLDFRQNRDLLIGTSTDEALTGRVNYIAVRGDTGNVGVGIVNPAERLEVSGNLKVSGTIIAPAARTLDSANDIKAYLERRLCEYRNGTWADGTGCTEPIKLTAASFAPASIDWAYDGGSCGAGFHICLWTEYFEYIAIIRRMGCPSGQGFNGGWAVAEPEDRNQMFHGHSNTGLGQYAAGPTKPGSGWLIMTQASNGTGCALSPSQGGTMPLWCCMNRAANF